MTGGESLKHMSRARCVLALTCAALAVMTVIDGWAYYREGIPENVFPGRPQLAGIHSAEPARGLLRVLASNPRYFTDSSRPAAALAGAHTWSNFQDNDVGDPPPQFDARGPSDFPSRAPSQFLPSLGLGTGALGAMGHDGRLILLSRAAVRKNGPRRGAESSSTAPTQSRP